eukprot:5928310-Amphidinium_carterae.1
MSDVQQSRNSLRPAVMRLDALTNKVQTGGKEKAKAVPILLRIKAKVKMARTRKITVERLDIGSSMSSKSARFRSGSHV